MTALKVSKLFSITHSTVSVWRLQGYMLDFVHLFTMGVTETPEVDNLEGRPHTFGHILYITSCKFREHETRLSLALLFVPLSAISVHLSLWQTQKFTCLRGLSARIIKRR